MCYMQAAACEISDVYDVIAVMQRQLEKQGQKTAMQDERLAQQEEEIKHLQQLLQSKNQPSQQGSEYI